MTMVPEKSTSFALACELLGQFIKDNNRGAASVAATRPSPPVTMRFMPGADVGEQEAPVEFFPLTAAVVHGDGKPTAGIREPPRSQLTIFYAGKVVVFDDFPADKAADLMRIASGSNGNPAADSMRGFAPPPPTAGGADSKAPSQPCMSAAMPLARKASIQRFLERRKDRISAKSPYHAAPSADHQSFKKEADDKAANRSWPLPPAVPAVLDTSLSLCSDNDRSRSDQ